MKYLIMFCVPFLTAILVGVFWSVTRSFARQKESKMNMGDFVIFHSRGLTVLMVVASALLIAALVILSIRNNPNLFISIIVFVLAVFFLLGAYFTSRENIAVKNDCIVHTPIFGKAVHYQFSDITKIEFTYYSNGSVLYWVYSNRRIFALDSSNAGTNLFLTRAKQFGITI
jgi:hypothetical protein